MSYRMALALIICFLSGTAFAVTVGHVDDFEDGTTQGWQEGGPSPNPPMNVADGGPAGVGDNYLQNASSGGFGAGSKQIIFNNGANWIGSFSGAGINLVRLDVRVDNLSEGPLHLRLAFEGTNGSQFASTDAVVVPADSAWHSVELHIYPGAFTQVGGANTFLQTIGDVAEVRLMHAPASPSWTASAYNGIVGYDNISSLSVSFFEGWFWETGVGNSPGVPELWEDHCFGPISIRIDQDDNWRISGSDACTGRTTTNSVPPRAYDNYDQGTGTIPFVETFEARSTRPLVNAGDNLLELYGEDVDGGVGSGEERLATVLADPSSSNLLIVGGYGSFEDANYTESYGFVLPFVKSTPQFKAERQATDVIGRWHGSFFNRIVSRNNINTNVSTTSLRVLDLQAAGNCAWLEPEVIPDPEVVNNGDFLQSVQIAFNGGVDLTDRGVFAHVGNRTRSACTYELDADGFLSVDFTITNNTVDPPVDFPVNQKFVVSDDNAYLVPAPDPDGVEEDPIGIAVFHRAPSTMPESLIEGNWLFYLNVTDHEATGAAHTAGSTGPQLRDLFGRGIVNFDNVTPGTPPDGYGGNWYSCEIDLVMSNGEYQANGQPDLGQVSTLLELDAERQTFPCVYNSQADGSVLMNLIVNDDGESTEEVLFAGYTNEFAEFMTLVDIDTRIENPGSPIGSLVDYGSVRHITAMKYNGDLNANEDGDEFSNLDEFLIPLPPPPPFRGIVALPNIGDGAAPEIGVAVEGSVRVHVRDASSGNLISDINYGSDPAIDMEVVPDLDGNGFPEIAVLAVRPSGQVRAFIKDSVSKGITGQPLFGSQYAGIDMTVMSDFSGNALPEIAVLGQDATDQVRVQVKDPVDNTVESTMWYGRNATALGVLSLQDVTGNGIEDVYTHSKLKAKTISRGQVRDPDTTAYHKTIFFTNIYDPVTVVALPDINGTGAADVAELGQDPVTGTVLVQVRDATAGAPSIKSMFLGSGLDAIDMVMINDTNGNGVPDLAVLLRNPDGTGLVKVRDALTGVNIRNIFYGNISDPVGLAALDDYSGNAAQEIAVLGSNGEAQRVQIRDSLAGTNLNNVEFP